jgi:hypothetical protein
LHKHNDSYNAWLCPDGSLFTFVLGMLTAYYAGSEGNAAIRLDANTSGRAASDSRSEYEVATTSSDIN